MRITSSDTVAGLPALRVRDALRHCRSESGFCLAELAPRLDLSNDEADKVLAKLVDEGYVEAYGDWWRTTIAGNALTMAKATKSVPRSKAQSELDAFLARVAEVNSSTDFLVGVQRVVLFGSFLDPNIDPVGDVDVAVGLAWQTEGDRPQLALAAARASGRRFGTYIERLCWPEKQTHLHLKGRSRVISMTATDDPILDQSPNRVIYERES